MKMNKLKYIWILAAALGFTACSDDDSSSDDVSEPLPALTAGDANFSTYVSLGNSLTAGFADGALYRISQENSMPNILSGQFSLVGGGNFSQPLMNDNTGGLLINGSQLTGFGPRLAFDGSGPTSITNLNPMAQTTTDIVLNNPTGPFNNMGVPGAKSFHLLAPSYGDLNGLFATPPTANPYFVRMASSPTTSVIADAMAQTPTFFSLWIGNNDVLGYALSGGESDTMAENYDPITPVDGPIGVGFTNTYNALISTLTSGGSQGVIANIPDVTSIPHFTTVPYNPLSPDNPDFGPQIPTLNTIFGAINQIYDALGESERAIVFSQSENSPVVIKDESLTDISAQISGALMASPTFPTFIAQFGLPAQAAPLVANLLGNTYGQTRQATAADLFVLPSSSVIGTVNTDYAAGLVAQGLPPALAGQFSAEGITKPLDDKWVLIPSEQSEIASATAAFNSIIESAANDAGLAFVDANTLLNQLANGGIASGDYLLTASLVTGGAFSLDGVHPNSRGYALIANEFLKAIDATYGSNFEASGNLVNIANYNTTYSAGLN